MSEVHPALIESFKAYMRREMNEEEIKAALMLRSKSLAFGGFDWTCTDGEEYGKGCNAVSHQVAVNNRPKPKPVITDSVKAEVLRWLVDQHKLDYHNCPTRIITHDYALKLATHLDEVAGKVK